MSKLTTREKTLVIILLVTVVLVCGYMFVMRPILADRQQNKILIVEKEAEKKNLQEQNASLPDLEKKLKETQEYVEKNKKDFFAKDITTWNAERYVTTLIEKHNIEVVAIDISGPNPFEISPEKKFDKEGKEIQQEPVKTDVNKITVTVSSGNSLQNLINYLDELKKDKVNISVNSWYYEIKEGKVKCSVSVDMYCA